MRKVYSIVIMLAVLASCGEKKSATVEDILATNDLEQIKTKKKELDGQQQVLNAQIEQLNQKIFELDTSKKLPLVTAFATKEEVFKHYVELQGNVKTKQNVLIYPEVMGQIKEVYVKEGQKVAEGQVLATIDDGGMQNQLAQLEASAQLAKTTFDRQQRLWEQKIGSEIQYLQAKTSYLTQKNAVAQLKKQLAKFEIKAPFSGEIDDVIKDPGTTVAPGMGSEIFRIVNLEKMYIESDVPESYITSISKGKKVIVEFPVLGKSLESKVRQAGNFINPANRTFKVEIAVDNKSGFVKPNLTAKLRINDYINEKAILLPQSVISENAKGEQYVYVVEKAKEKHQGIAKRRIIKTGLSQGEFVEVVTGLKPSERIIKEGARTVKEGQLVEIKG